VLFFIVLSLDSACAGPIVVWGGPVQTRRVLAQPPIAPELRPLLEGESVSTALVDELEQREQRSRYVTYPAFGFLAGCLILPPIDQYRFRTLSYVGIGSCAVSIAFSLLALDIKPARRDYKHVLDVFNSERPSTPWHAPALGVP